MIKKRVVPVTDEIDQVAIYVYPEPAWEEQRPQTLLNYENEVNREARNEKYINQSTGQKIKKKQKKKNSC